MPSTTTPPRRVATRVGGNGAHRPETPPPRPPSIQRRRRTTAAIVAVLCIAGGALAGVVAFKAGSDRQSVLASSHSLAAGHILEPSDLRVVDVSTDGGLGFLLAATESSVVGRPLAVPVASGAPLVSSDLGSPTVTGRGEAVVGVLCKAGQYPPSLAPGDTVEIVDTGVGTAAGIAGAGVSAGALGASSPIAMLTATVLGTDAPTDTATVGTVVSLRVAASDAPAVARAAAAGRISLILVPPGG
jgi:Flp pilus assembly protein CpaB